MSELFYFSNRFGNNNRWFKNFQLTDAKWDNYLFSGIESVSSGYKGNYLGPTLFMEKGENVELNITNTMPFATTTYWHGILYIPKTLFTIILTFL